MNLALFAHIARRRASELHQRADSASYVVTNENGLSGTVQSAEAATDRKRASLLIELAEIAEGKRA